jgi:hypothetical protein
MLFSQIAHLKDQLLIFIFRDLRFYFWFTQFDFTFLKLVLDIRKSLGRMVVVRLF